MKILYLIQSFADIYLSLVLYRVVLGVDQTLPKPSMTQFTSYLGVIRAHFLARSKPRMWSANHREVYVSKRQKAGPGLSVFLSEFNTFGSKMSFRFRHIINEYILHQISSPFRQVRTRFFPSPVPYWTALNLKGSLAKLCLLPQWNNLHVSKVWLTHNMQ